MTAWVPSRRRLWLAILAGLALVLGSLVVSSPPPASAFSTSAPAPVPSVSAGGYMSCGVATDGTAACWGENGMPSNDTANTSPGGAATPPAGVTFLEVNAGYATACGVRTDRSLVCWGSNRFNKHAVPEGSFSHVAPGLNYVCALRTDGTIACWGGDDPAVDPDQKVVRDVPAGQFSQLTMGTRHACALRADGSGQVVCWGHNTIRLGVNEGQTVVPPGSYRYVSVSNFTSCALRTDGTPVCWARNLNGQQTYPTDGSGAPLTFTELSTGNAHVCGLRADRSVVCWGRNFEGQASPVPTGAYTQVTAGTFHTCGMREGEATAVCWGNNMSGRVQPNLSAVAPPQGYADFAYSFQFAMNPSPIAGAGAIAGISPSPRFTLVAGALPAGLSLSASGLLSGTPTEAGTYPIRVAASNGLSPPDCVVPVTLAAPNDSQSMPCVPGDSSSVATATRTFTLTVSPDAPPPGTVAGRVTTAADGAPVAGASIAVAHSGGSAAGETTTGADGTYSLPDLPPGTYLVTASGAELEPQTKPATVTESQTATVDFALVPLIRPAIVSVWANHYDTVSDGLFVDWTEEIRPFLGGLDRPARYTVHADDACASAPLATGADAFWLGSHPNRRDLVLDTPGNLAPGGAYHLRVLADTELGMDFGEWNAAACAPFTNLLAPADRSAVAGRVTGAATGAPIAGATVTVVRTIREPGTVAGQATTDVNGDYTVGHLPPGPYQVRAEAPGFVAATQSVSTTSGVTATRDFALARAAAAVGDGYTHYGSDTAMVVAAPGVLANDADATGVVLATGPAHGSLVLNADGSFGYRPDEDFVGTDSFTYRAVNAASQSAPATVTITVGAGCGGRQATVVGTNGPDRLTGTAAADVIAALGGDDTVNGQGGDDVVCGGRGRDTVNAGGGDDHADGGSGNDILRGDVGHDALIGGDGADTLLGDAGNDLLAGGAGSPDSCQAGAGTDALAPSHGCEKVTGLP